MIQRGGEVVIRRLENVPHMTLQPLMQATIAPGACVDPEEYDIYRRLEPWSDAPKSVCPGRGEEARDDDGDGFYEVPVNTMEGCWSLLRSWWRPHRGISQDNWPR
jgi:transposase